MPGKVRKSRTSDEKAIADRGLDAFTRQLEQALDNVTDPAWLGENSPLASPYFLGARLRGEQVTAAERGHVLQKMLRQAVDLLARQDEESAYYAHLLDLGFFRGRPWLEVASTLHISSASYYRHRDKAIQQLEDTLISQVNPLLYLDSPPAHDGLFGRQDVTAHCMRALQEGQTVALTGPGGVGKTTLGAHLVTVLAPQPAFWFTLRPGLNDHLSSLLFSLGYFLHTNGASSLWRQLVADVSQVKIEVAHGLSRHDLCQLHPLLCFDEVDLLQPADIEAHAQLVSFLESLRGLSPLLLIGQQPLIEADLQRALDGLSSSAIDQMLAQAAIRLSAGDLARLQAYTHGSPRLIELFIALHRSGEPLADALQRIPASPSLEFMLDRICRRMDENERLLLSFLSVFRRSTPRDAWRNHQPALDNLIERRLVHADHRDGVYVLPAFKGVLYHWLSPEDRQNLHSRAAAIRADRGEYTAAAYHYLEGRQPSVAVRLWYHHQRREINQGHAKEALALFESLSKQELRGQDREKLVLLRAELFKLSGKYDQARHDLRSTLWRTPMFKARARQLEGDVAEVGGQLEQALAAYREGLETTEALAEGQVAHFHKNLGWVYMCQQELDQAWREALLARYEVENLQGQIQYRMGHYEQAGQHYLDALKFAQEIKHTRGEAKVRKNLAALLARQGNFEQAEKHWQKAKQYFERIGDLTNLASIQANQAFMYNLAGRPQAVIPPAQKALALFERLNQSYGIAVAAQNMAEAYQLLGELETAEHFAMRVIQQEEAATLPDGFRVLGEIKLAQGQFQNAYELIQQSIQLAHQNQDRFLEAYAWRSLGRVYLAQQNAPAAREALDQAIELFTCLGLPQEVEKTRLE
ncbi:MAG: tetratricopeptide repeat protein [Thermoflexales bacterium]|nr:tetratricopeptide repeat protein [Thermoflexales bacterium]